MPRVPNRTANPVIRRADVSGAFFTWRGRCPSEAGTGLHISRGETVKSPEFANFSYCPLLL